VCYNISINPFFVFMLEPTYRSALSHAWQLVWHHKIMWIFGIFSVVLSHFGVSNFVGQIMALDRRSFFYRDYSAFFSFDYWQPLISGWSLWLFLIVLLLVILVVLISVAAEGAIIAAASEWFHKHTTPRFDQAWHRGIKHFWRLLAVRVMQRIILGALLLLIGYLLSRFAQVESSINTFYKVVVFAAGFLVAFMVSAISIYAAGYIVHDENSLRTALEKATYLFRRHVVVSMELSVIELVLSLCLGVLFISSSFWLLVPSVILSVIAGLTGYLSLITFGIVFSLVLFVITVILLGGIFYAFIISTWIYLFMKMHHEGVASRILSWLGMKRV